MKHIIHSAQNAWLSPKGLSYRELRKRLFNECFDVIEHRVQTLMSWFCLYKIQRIAHTMTTKAKNNHAVAKNRLIQNVTLFTVHRVWAVDVTYLKSVKGSMYLALVMNLYGRRIIGRHIYKRMTANL